MDWEADHSMPDFDLNAEISSRLAPAKASSGAADAASARDKKSEQTKDAEYFPEDEHSSMDWESDHSMTDFDLSEEIEAKLGAAPPPSPPSISSPALPPLSREPAPAAAFAPETATATDSTEHAEQYFPEDERSSQDWEDDHSMTHFDLDTEVANKLSGDKAAANAAASPAVSPSGRIGAAQEQAYYPDDERSSMDWEDDHSTADFDLNAELDSKLGKRAEKTPEAAPGDDSGYIHPGLAASLSASLAYARQGLRQEDEPEKGEKDGTPGLGQTEASASEKNAAAHCPVSAAAAMPTESGVEGLAANAQADAGKDAQENSQGGEKKPPFDDAGPAPAPSAVPAVGAGAPAAVADDEEEDEEEEEEDEDDDDEEEDVHDRPMTLRDHLNELRKRVFYAFLWSLAGFIGCYPFAEDLFKLLLAPLTKVMPSASRLIYTSPPEAFFIYMKVAFVAGLFATSPLVFYQVWAFVAPGLYKEEKVYIIPIAFFSALCFICGGAFCYFVAFPFAFEFFMSYSTDMIVAMPSITETLGFVLQLLLAFGLIFELPLFVFFLARLGIVTADLMRRMRRYAILANVIIAAILTPPDVMSQMLMACPLLLLYEISILIAVIFGKKKPAPVEEDEEEEEDEDGEDEATSASSATAEQSKSAAEPR